MKNKKMLRKTNYNYRIFFINIQIVNKIPQTFIWGVYIVNVECQ
jgi:hypothetical protein